MPTEKEYLPKRVLSIHAHPDDQEFTVAGTLAKWAQAGCEIISVIIITSGDAGSNKPEHDEAYKPTLAIQRHFSGLPVLKYVKSIRYSVLADRAATADGLNPLMIIQTAKTIS